MKNGCMRVVSSHLVGDVEGVNVLLEANEGLLLSVGAKKTRFKLVSLSCPVVSRCLAYSLSPSISVRDGLVRGTEPHATCNTPDLLKRVGHGNWAPPTG